MNTQTITRNQALPGGMFFGDSRLFAFVRGNIVIEKRISLSRLDRLYKKSFLHGFWAVLSSPVN